MTAFHADSRILSRTLGGADGIRTRVRTRKQYAFYMLIFALIFEQQQDRSHQLLPYLLKISS